MSKQKSRPIRWRGSTSRFSAQRDADGTSNTVTERGCEVRRQPPASLHADLQPVHDGAALIGFVARRVDLWRATAKGGYVIGDFAEAIEARRAILCRYREGRS